MSRVAVEGESFAISTSYAAGAKVILCIRASAVIAADESHQPRLVQLRRKIREAFYVQADSPIVVECAGFTLLGSAPSEPCQTRDVSGGSTVIAALEPDAIRVIAAEDSH